MLFVLVPAAVVAVALLGLSMCRLAALSDSDHAVALAEWTAAGCLAEQKAVPADRPREQISIDPRGGPFRATG
ncbi:MAG: hypothetical protein ACLQBY_15910 [Solirubrobacteraceae bacterium]